MSRIVRRALVGAAMTTVIAAMALGNGNASGSRSASTALPTLQYSQLGVPANIAAAALNRLAARQAAHSTRSLTSVRFILNWLPNVEFAGLWIAQKYGWW